MDKLITSRTCPYGLKCWAYIDMLDVPVVRINVEGDEIDAYLRDPKRQQQLPFLYKASQSIYDSGSVCVWLLLAFAKKAPHEKLISVIDDFQKYHAYEDYYCRINTSFFRWASNGFDASAPYDDFRKEFETVLTLTHFNNERIRVSYLNASLIGLVCRFRMYPQKFNEFLYHFNLVSWYSHLNAALNLDNGEYRLFGDYFYRYIEAKR